ARTAPGLYEFGEAVALAYVWEVGSMLSWRWGILCPLCIVIAGCGEPGRLVPASPPGVEPERIIPPTEAGPPQALGETAVRSAPGDKEKSTLPASPPAPPTAPGEKKRTKSGVAYETLKAGTGPEVKAGQTVVVHYTGTLADGTKFDSSRDRGEPTEFPIGVGRVIQGWDDAVPGMKVGERRKLTIPAHLGYGAKEQPKIPANSDLVF